MARKSRKAPQPEPLTAQRLTTGRPGPAGTLLRLARPGDEAAFGELIAATGVPLNPVATATMATGHLGAAIMEALQPGTGRDALLRPLAEASAAGDPSSAFPALSLPLVAVDETGHVVGVLLGQPPGGIMRQLAAAGVPLPGLLTLAFGSAKIKGLAVTEAARGAGIGSALLMLANRAYHKLGLFLVYGQFSVGSNLGAFYTRQGFEVLPTTTGVNLQPQFGTPLVMSAEPGEQLFIRWRNNPPRYVWEVPGHLARA